jgi:hypothetical protein
MYIGSPVCTSDSYYVQYEYSEGGESKKALPGHPQVDVKLAGDWPPATSEQGHPAY